MKNKHLTSILYNPEQEEQLSYESLLDIFTIISFALILVAFFYKPPQKTNVDNSSIVEAFLENQGQGAPQSIPKDLVFIIIFKEQGLDKIMVIKDGGHSSTDVILKESIITILGRMKTVLEGANSVIIAWHVGEEEPNPSILVNLQRWIAGNKQQKYELHFTGNQDG